MQQTTSRDAYIKPNSVARKRAQHMVNVTNDMCQTLAISTDEWLSIFFEAGCRYAELKAPTMHYALEWTTTESLGYWALWMDIYTNDDELLLRQGVHDITEYKNLKMTFK